MTGNKDFINVAGLRSIGNIDSFSSIPSLDPASMSSISAHVLAQLERRPDGRMGPLSASSYLAGVTKETEMALENFSTIEKNAPEADCLRLDAEALLNLARYYANKHIAGLRVEEYHRSGYPRCLTSARHHLFWAREYWRRLAEIADGHYAPLLKTLRMWTPAFRWHSQLPLLDADLGWIAQLEKAWDPDINGAAPQVLAHLPGISPSRAKVCQSSQMLRPVEWRTGSFENVRIDGKWALRSQGGQILFDFGDFLLSDTDVDLVLDVEYYDPGPLAIHDELMIHYGRTGQPLGNLVEAGRIALGNSKGWHRQRLRLNHARFADGAPALSDITVSSSNGREFALGEMKIEIERWPQEHLDLAVPGKDKKPVNQVQIHWRHVGETVWHEASMNFENGEDWMEVKARGREYGRYTIPANETAFEYYFTAQGGNQTFRLPAGETSYLWHPLIEETPPVLVSEALQNRSGPEGPVEIRARVSDQSGVGNVTLYHKPIPSDLRWERTEMKQVSEGLYSATVALTRRGLLYRFEASDKLGNSATYPNFLVETPYLVVPSWDANLQSSAPPSKQGGEGK